MRIVIFEGSPEEYLRVAETLSRNSGDSKPNNAVPPSKPAEGPRPVTNDEAIEILSRRPLSKNIKNILEMLYRAEGRMITSEELRDVNKHNSDEFRGMMGAFGRRVVNTVGSDVYFFERQWDFQAYSYRWALTEQARQAIKELGLFG